MRTRGILLALLLSFGPSIAAAADEPMAVTLDEAIQRSLEVQPSMVQADGNRRTAAAAVRSAWGSFLPSLSTSANGSRSNVARIDNTTGRPVPKDSYTLGLNASLLLFDGFRRYAEKKVASAERNASEAAWLDQRAQVALATKQAYFDALVQEELVRTALAQLERTQRQLDIAIGKVRAGSGTKSDSLRSTVELGNARIALLRSQGGLASARAELGRQIGVDTPVRAAPDSADPAPPDTLSLRAAVLAEAPQIARSDAQLRAARAQVSAARGEYWPTMNLSFNDSWQGAGSPFSSIDDYSETSSWRLGLSWTLFNGFQRDENQVRAAVQREVATAEAAETRRRIDAELTQQLSAIAVAYEQIGIARSNVEAAAEDLRVQGERYRVGASTIVDLSTAQANMTEAEVNLIRARYDYFTARAQVEALAGREL